MVQDTTASKESKEYENKRKVIEEYGIDIQSLENLDDEEEEISEENKNIEEVKELKNNKYKKKNNRDMNNINYIDLINNSSENNINLNQEIEIKKPSKRKEAVNTLEYYNQIKQNINYEELKNLYNNINTIIINTDSLGESSKEHISNSNKKKSIKKEKNEEKIIKQEESENSSTDSETRFNYKTKKNKRSKTEIREYMQKQI